VAVKEAVFPFSKFSGVDLVLGPEMRSTGEVMGIAPDFAGAFAKAQLAAGQRLPSGGCAFISVNNDDKPNVLPIARNLADLGFAIVATRGTAAYLRAHGIAVEVVFKVNEGRPNIVDHILNNQVQLIVNTPLGRESFFDDRAMRRVAMLHNVPCITTLTGASAAVEAIRAVLAQALEVRAIQDYHAEITARAD
jgi:carbamoyl-phosphate synthase large subunit